MKLDIPLQIRYGGLIALVVGPMLIALCGVAFFASEAAQSWPTATASVVRSEVNVSKKAGGFKGSRTNFSDYYTADVEYRFVLDGVEYTGNRIHKSYNPSGFERAPIEECIRQYRPGSEILIHYSPRNPHVSCIDPSTDVVGLTMGLGMGLALIPIGVVLLVYARRLQPSEPDAARSTVTATLIRKPRNRTKTTEPWHWAVRTAAIAFGLGLFFVGALGLPLCSSSVVELFRAATPAATNTIVAGFITLTIFAGMAIAGAYLIVRGTRRVSL